MAGPAGGADRSRRPPGEDGSLADAPQDWPGQRLGLPRSGRGSVARVGRRVLGVVVDWLLSLLVANAFLDDNAWLTLAVFAVVQLGFVATAGSSPGHAVTGLRVVRVSGGSAGPVPALVRAVLLSLAFPALVWDVDQRGLHDRVAGTVLVRR